MCLGIICLCGSLLARANILVSSHVRTEPQGVISLWDSLECVELGDLLDGG